MTDASAPQPAAPAGGINHIPKFFVKQRLALTVNRYEISAADADGTEGAIIAIAQQKRLAFKEKVTFFEDEARTRPVFSFKARNIMELAAVYDVFDAAGTPIGFFQKDFAASLMRSSFHFVTPGVDAYGNERNQVVAVLRRLIDLPFSFHFDFTEKSTGRLVMSSERQFSLRDRYTVTVPDSRIDFRVAAAMAVGLDALLQR